MTKVDRRLAYELYVQLGVDATGFTRAVRDASASALVGLRRLLLEGRDPVNEDGVRILDEVARQRGIELS